MLLPTGEDDSTPAPHAAGLSQESYVLGDQIVHEHTKGRGAFQNRRHESTDFLDFSVQSRNAVEMEDAVHTVPDSDQLQAVQAMTCRNTLWVPADTDIESLKLSNSRCSTLQFRTIAALYVDIEEISKLCSWPADLNHALLCQKSC